MYLYPYNKNKDTNELSTPVVLMEYVVNFLLPPGYYLRFLHRRSEYPAGPFLPVDPSSQNYKLR
jgi:hypothetical protein